MTEKRTKPRADRPFLVLGLVMFFCGCYALVEGVRHTISGKPVPATSWTTEGSGPESLLISACFFVGAVYVIRRGLRGGK